MPRHRKPRLFTSLSRRKRRKQVIVLKNLIRKERSRCGGIFYDECEFTRFNEASGNIWAWSDIYFTGQDPAVFWNAEIITAQMAFNDAVHSRAFNEAYIRLSEQEREREFKPETRPDYNAKGEIVSHTLVARKAREYAAFDGLTFSQYVRKREQEIARDDPPVIYPRYQYLPAYAYGLGLRIIVAASSLSQQVIEEAIGDFRSRGEREWCSSRPVSF
ncbi:hypothetical protein [Cedecea colo]|uniref:Uncharacterized protein n=1 Tax=Cedecea colo TaxID=2552946 RepID=A0ABX0VGY7_9ENTR|nr:hypothetical protein [Cedecea colo]NIY46354.1 hypothetical protein [Cedecea colo]